MQMEKQLRNHIRKIRAARIFMLGFLVIAIASLGTVLSLKEHCYKLWVNPADKNGEDAVAKIVQAIDLFPDRPEGYHNIVTIYLQDEWLNEAEAQAIRELLLRHQGDLNQYKEAASMLYQRLGFVHARNSVAPVQERLKMAFSYFEMVGPETGNCRQQALRNAYLALGSYCAEFLWATNADKIPDKAEVENVVHAIYEILENSSQLQEQDRQAFTCCVASVLDRHRSFWIAKIGETAVLDLTECIGKIAHEKVATAVAKRLQTELQGLLKNENIGEVVPDV